jgi:hypothetical protein
MEHLLNWDLLDRRLLPAFVALVSVAAGAQQASPEQNAPPQERPKFRAEVRQVVVGPRIAIDKAAPDAPVAVNIEFAASTTVENVAELVFAQQIPSLSVFTKEYSANGTYMSNGHCFSYLGPPREEQEARARCQSKAPYGPSGEPGSSLPVAGRTKYMEASIMLTAEQARRWQQNPPDIVSKVSIVHVLSAEEADLSKQIMRNVLTMQLPVTGIAELPPGCDKYMYIQP